MGGRKRKWANGQHTTEPKNKTKRKPEWEPTGPFRLLDLPRELRDMVYGHVLGPIEPEFQASKTPIAYADPPGLKFGCYGAAHNQNNVQPLLWFQNPLPEVRPAKTTRAAILQTSKQVYGEAKEVLYKSHIFQVDMNNVYWRFDPPAPADEDEDAEDTRMKAQYGQHYTNRTTYSNTAWLRAAAAVSIGWDLSSIRRMHLHIDLRQGWNNLYYNLPIHSMEMSHLCNLLQVFNFSALYKMTKLRELRVSFVHDGLVNEPGTLAFFRGTGRAPLAMRDFMRRFISSIPKSVGKVRWGLSEEERQEGAFITPRMSTNEKKYIENHANRGSYAHVDAEVMEALAREFEYFRGGDAEYYLNTVEAEGQGEVV